MREHRGRSRFIYAMNDREKDLLDIGGEIGGSNLRPRGIRKRTQSELWKSKLKRKKKSKEKETQIP